MRQWTDIIKNVSMLTQFGLSLLTPLLLCLGICWWLSNRFDLGGWIYLPGFFFSGLENVPLTAASPGKRGEKRKSSV